MKRYYPQNKLRPATRSEYFSLKEGDLFYQLGGDADEVDPDDDGHIMEVIEIDPGDDEYRVCAILEGDDEDNYAWYSVKCVGFHKQLGNFNQRAEHGAALLLTGLFGMAMRRKRNRDD